MSAVYFDNYLQAVLHPLPALKKTFEVELGFLKGHVHPQAMVLDVGCGIGRPTLDLAPFVKKIVGIDNDHRMLNWAKKRKSVHKNLDWVSMDALQLGFPMGTFDVSYSTFNLIGTLEQKHRQKLVNEMAKVTKQGGKVINTTWRDEPEVTRFLRAYYPSIGIEIIEIDEAKSVTSKGTFDRLSKKELVEYYKAAGLKNIRFFDLPPAWRAVVGTK